MKDKSGLKSNSPESNKFSEEPIGIVISNGRSAETVPMFRACLWYSFPETESTAQAKAA